MAEQSKPEQSRVNPAGVKTNDLMAFIYWGMIQTTTYDGQVLSVKNADSPPASLQAVFEVRGAGLVEASFSADWYGREEKVSRTAMAEILTRSYNRPFTVVFDKADGGERKLRGRLLQPEPVMGRSHVEDLDIAVNDPKGRIRLIDHRTLKSLIVDGVKYTVR